MVVVRRIRKYARKSFGVITVCGALLIGASACISGDESADPSLGSVLGMDEVNDTPKAIPSPSPTPEPSGSPSPSPTPSPSPSPSPTPPPWSGFGASCRNGNDPDHICLALKYVVYEDSSNGPVASDQDVLDNMDQINSVWSQCNIGFQIDKYLPIDPTDVGLEFNTSTSSALGTIRSKFQDSETLVVVSTGTWSGSLGAGSANAWATMPGYGLYGVVLEEPVATYPNIIAHELGHYLNLDHLSDSSNVMNAIIYQGSTSLTASQCTQARSAAAYYWSAMYR